MLNSLGAWTCKKIKKTAYDFFFSFPIKILIRSMDFLRSSFFKNEPLTLTQCEKSISNVLITGESNFEERNVPLIRGSFLKKELLKKSIL